MNALTVSTPSTVTQHAAKADGIARRRVHRPRAPVTRALHRAGHHDALGTDDVALPSALSRRAALLAAGFVALTPLSATCGGWEERAPAPSAHARGAGRPREGGRRGAKRVRRSCQAGVRFRAQPVPPNAAGVLAALTPGSGAVPAPRSTSSSPCSPAIHVRDGRRAGHDGHGHRFRSTFGIVAERVEPYTQQYSPLKIEQGKLTDPLYFDFISYTQFKVVAKEIPRSQSVFEERSGAEGTTKVIRRDANLSDNKLLPAVLAQRLGDTVYARMRYGFEGTDFDVPEPAFGGDVDEAAAGMRKLVNAFVRKGTRSSRAWRLRKTASATGRGW